MLSPIEQWRLNLRNRYATPYARGQAASPTYQPSWWSSLTPWKEELGETFGQVWQKPFTAFGAAVTSPFTPAVPGTEGLGWWEREQAEYEKWEEPTWTMPWGGEFRPTKGIVETLPMFGGTATLGLAGKLGMAAAKAGMAGRAAGLGVKALKPLTAAARAEQAVMGAAIKGVGAVAKPIAKPIGQAIQKTVRDIGFLEKFRPFQRVFEKMGLYKEVYEPAMHASVKEAEEKIATGKWLSLLAKRIPKGRESLIFNARGNAKIMKQLTPDEQDVVKQLSKFFDDWAVRLKLPKKAQIKDYMPHIIEAEARSAEGLSAQAIKFIDFTVPKKITMPFFKKRYGFTAGLREDAISAAQVYQNYALRKFYRDPTLKKIAKIKPTLKDQPNAYRYLEDFSRMIGGRRMPLDRQMDASLRAVADDLAKVASKLPVKTRPAIEKLITTLNTEGASNRLAYNMASLYYTAWLGFRPSSAIKNLSQNFLTVNEVGVRSFAKGFKMRGTAEAKKILSEIPAVRSRALSYLPEQDIGLGAKWIGNVRDKAMIMFRKADKFNVENAALAGYAQAKGMGLPHNIAIKRAEEVMMKCQYLYTKLGSTQFAQTAIGRTLTPFTSWPINFMELANQWARGQGSRVFKDYVAQTGAKIATGEGYAIFNRQAMGYLALTAGAIGVQQATGFRAPLYTGQASLASIANMLKGDLPGMTIPAAVIGMMGGAIAGDTRQVKSSFSEIDPRRFVLIYKQFSDIAEGKKDWGDLFIYKKKPESLEARRERIKLEAYQKIEDNIWAKLPREYRDIAKKSRALDKYESKRLLRQYPGLVMAMNRIEKDKQRWLLQNRRMLQSSGVF